MKNYDNINGNFKEILKEEANKIDVNLDDDTLELFEKYKNILLEWNDKINLTAITDEYEIIMKHFVDCLEIVKYINITDKVIDVGTGAGFPGIVIAIYFKSKINVTLVDSLNKRLLFLSNVVDELKLNNINIIHARAEELGRNSEHREMYDVVVSRAVAGLNILLEYDSPFIKVNGKCLLLKSDNVDKEIEEAKNSLKQLNLQCINKHLYKYLINDEEYRRCVLEIKKISNTKEKYPRNFGKIKKNPL